MNAVTVTFPDRRTYEAALAAVAEKATEPVRDSDGRGVSHLDTQDALRVMEAAR